jgi:hypothetical protein
MKNQLPLLCLFLMTTSSALNAAHLEYKAYRGSAVQPAGSGAIETIKGVDFWSNGVPDRRYQVIGLIEDHRDAHEELPSEFYEMVSKKIKEVKGDAAIIVAAKNETQAILGDNSGDVVPEVRTTRIIQVVRYVK